MFLLKLVQNRRTKTEPSKFLTQIKEKSNNTKIKIEGTPKLSFDFLDRVLEVKARKKTKEERSARAYQKSILMQEKQKQKAIFQLKKKELKKSFALFKENYFQREEQRSFFYSNWLILINFVKILEKSQQIIQKRKEIISNEMINLVRKARVRRKWVNFMKAVPKDSKQNIFLKTYFPLQSLAGYMKISTEKKCKAEINHFFILLTSTLRFKDFFNQNILDCKFFS